MTRTANSWISWLACIKQEIRRAVPSSYARVRRIYWVWRGWQAAGRQRAIEAFVERHGYVVQHGPFAGLKYLTAAAGSELGPKLIGSYECELHPFLERLLAKPCQTAVVIGCAEGYYAVGVASRWPDTTVFAFESDGEARELCNLLAHSNNCEDRVQILGECTASSLGETLSQGALIICDCEGAEIDILRPDLVPTLRSCALIVEVHDYFTPAITSNLIERFETTHECVKVRSAHRNVKQYESLAYFSAAQQKRLVSECRSAPITEWLVLTPLT